jgi:DNA-binding response OmpR family regulator
MPFHVLLVEDNVSALNSLTEVLEMAGYRVVPVASGEQALALLTEQRFDVVITDIKMRRIDGLQVLRAVRNLPLPPAVILITGFGSLDTSIAALRHGAYDYLLKPCDPVALLQSVEGAVQRRNLEMAQANLIATMRQGVAQLEALQPAQDVAVESGSAPEAQPERYVHVGDLSIDRFRHMAALAGRPLNLTSTEYALLHCLAQAQGRVLDYAEMIRQIYGYSVERAEARQLLKTHAHNLRRKLGPRYLVNVRGIGYMLIAPEGTP